MRLHSLQALPPEVLAPASSATASLGARIAALRAFPGPLGASTSRDKVARWAEEQAQASTAADRAGIVCSPAEPSGLHSLYLLLRAAALHQGKLSSAPYTPGSASPVRAKVSGPPPEADVVSALLGEAAAATQSAALLQAVPDEGPHTAAATVTEVQQLLLEGRREEAIRWAAVGSDLACSRSASGLRGLQPCSLAAVAPYALISCLLNCSIAATLQSHFSPGAKHISLTQLKCRVATESQQWGVALLLARLLGEAAIASTATAFSRAALPPAAPLRTLLLQLGGAGGSAAEVPPEALAAWPLHLALLGSNRSLGDEGALAALGAALARSGRLIPAHCALLLAGTPLAPAADMLAAAACGAAPGLVLLGCDPAAAPRTYASLEAVMRTEAYAWAMTAGEL